MEMVLTKMRCEMFFSDEDNGDCGGGEMSFWAKQSLKGNLGFDSKIIN